MRRGIHYRTRVHIRNKKGGGAYLKGNGGSGTVKDVSFEVRAMPNINVTDEGENIQGKGFFLSWVDGIGPKLVSVGFRRKAWGQGMLPDNGGKKEDKRPSVREQRGGTVSIS